MADTHLIAAIKRVIPPLSPAYHKGQAGRTLIVGGSKNYVGAPYYACMSSMLVGADMSHILCEERAGSTIRTMSPDIIVLPDLRQNPSTDSPQVVFQRVKEVFERIHSVIIGPGLGRDTLVFESLILILQHLRTINKPTVIDADGLWLINGNLSLVEQWPSLILTPNKIEFERLWQAAHMPKAEREEDRCKDLAARLGTTILHKGATDVISNGRIVRRIDIEGSLKRCGGQGDILSGACGTFLAWLHLCGSQGNGQPDTTLAAAGASLITRTSSRLAFERKGRSTLSTDILAEVGNAYRSLFDNSKL